jgi:signal transduction histidine kinase/DNA-binding response OmpR family regulator
MWIFPSITDGPFPKSEEMQMGNILVVDDERSIRVTLKAFLEADGHCVETAEEAEAAMALLQNKPMDVIFTDIILPRVSGVDLLRRIHERSPHVQVIMMTGEPTLESASESLRLGAVDYLQKPVGKNEILKAVRNALHVKHLSDERQRLEEENRNYMSHLEHLVEKRTHALMTSEATLRRRAEELFILNRLARKVNESISVDDAINCGLGEIVQATSPDLAIFFLLTGEDLALKGMFPEQSEIEWQPQDVHRVGECLCGLAVRSEKAVYSSDIRSDPRCTLEECVRAGFCSFAALPLRSGSEIMGILGIASLRQRDFQEHASFLEALANEMSIGLNKSLLYEKVQQHAAELQARIIQIREAEAERLRLQAQLQQAQKMEAMGTLAGGIAHDFNNILAAIMGYTELMLGTAPEDSSTHHYLMRIFGAGLRAKELVQQILTFCRKSEQATNPVQVNPIAKEALKLLRASLPSTIQICPKMQSNLAVMADPTKIHQVLMNLCTNAAHAMRKKGGVLDVSLTDLFVDSQKSMNHPQLLPGPHVRLVVRDTGHGMSRFLQDRIFDPFFTTKKKGEGTGLGLSVVHGIVMSLNGRITVQSGPGKGTCFEIFLPAVAADNEKKLSGEEMLPIGSEHILLVDDEEVLVEANQHILESLGYKVTGATGAREALEVFRAQPKDFDLVITDMTMPHMTGDKLAKAMVEMRPDLPVILCTGFNASINANDMALLKVKALLYKPIPKQEIAETVRKILDACQKTAGS